MTHLRALLLCACAGLAAACGREPQPVVQDEAPVVEAAPAPAPPAPVTEAQVREVASAASAAVGKFDVYKLRPSLAEDVSLVAIPAPTFGPTLKVQGRDRVLAQLDSSWSNVQKPSYSARAGEVKLAADGASGTMAFKSVSRFTHDRHDYVEETDDVYVVAMRDDVPLVVEIHQTSTGLTIDGARRF